MKRTLKQVFLYSFLALTLVPFSVRSMNKEIALSKDKQNKLNNLFLAAASKGDQEAFKNYLSKGANINAEDADGDTSLHKACVHKNIEVLKLILNYKNININAKGFHGRTPLHIACIYECSEAVKLLLNHRNINVETEDDQGCTVLRDTCYHGSYEIIKLLLNFDGINVNSPNDKGETPLHLACQDMCGNKKIVKLLIQKGANIRALNNNNHTPLDVTYLYTYSGSHIKNYLTNAEKELAAFIKNPLASIQVRSLTTGLTTPHLTKILYNLEKDNIEYRYRNFMYWFSQIYLNPDFVVLGALLDTCKLNTFKKHGKSLIVNVHNFPKDSKELATSDNLVKFGNFDLEFIYNMSWF